MRLIRVTKMRYKFIVDENIILCGLKGTDEHDNLDTSSADFLTKLLKNCHKILVDKELNNRYNKRAQEINIIRQGILPEMDKIILAIIATSEKIERYYNEIPELPSKNSIPRKDIYLVKVAYYFKIPIITLDDKLKSSVNNCKWLKDENVIAYSPKEALGFVSEK